MSLRVLNDRVLVQRNAAEDRTPGGIIVPDTAKGVEGIGLVLAVGPGRLWEGKRIPVSVKRDDVVIFSKHAGTEAKINGASLTLLREDEIIAVCEQPSET